MDETLSKDVIGTYDDSCQLCKTSQHICRVCKKTLCNFCEKQDPNSDNEMHLVHNKNDNRCVYNLPQSEIITEHVQDHIMKILTILKTMILKMS